MIGTDVEFVAIFTDVTGKNHILQAGVLFDNDTLSGNRETAVLGIDGCQYLFEYRATPSNNPGNMVAEFRNCLVRIRGVLPPESSLVAVPYLHVPGVRQIYLGGHIHFDLRAEKGIKKDLIPPIMTACDKMMVEQFQDIIAPKHKSRNTSGQYGAKYKDERGSGMRKKAHGAEYRAAMTFLAYPQLTWAYLTIGEMIWRAVARDGKDISALNLSDLVKMYAKEDEDMGIGAECIFKCMSDSPMELYVDMLRTWEVVT